jgi:hypothetical protein
METNGNNSNGRISDDRISDDSVSRPRLVVDNRGEPLFKRSVAACRKRRLISVHREWDDDREWWVGQVVANAETYRTGSYVTPEQAFAASIAFYYEIVANVQREERLDAERAAIAAAALIASDVGEHAGAYGRPPRRTAADRHAARTAAHREDV